MDERSLPLSTCVVNLHDGTITGHDGSFLSRLAPGVLKLLCYLEHRVGESVSKEQLIAEVWGGSVKEGAVGVAIGRLRSALQDTEKVIVETVETMMGSSYRLNLGRAAARPPISSNLDRYAGAFEGGGRGRPGWSQRLLRARRIALRGPSGVGKTHLALGIARALRAPGYGLTGGIWFIDLGYAVEGREITAALRRTLGPHRHSPSSGPSPRLLVFDNCGACGPALAAVLHGLNRERDGLHWLVLSRHPLKLPACEIIDLKWLDREAEMALFLSRPWRVEHPVPGGREQQEVRALVRRLGGQPLWIRLFGLLSDTMPVAALNRCLDEMGVRAPLRRGDPRSTSTARLLDWLWSQLSELERRVLARILLAREGGTLDELGAPSENWRLAGAVRQLQSYGVVWCLRQEDQRPCVRVLPVAWDHLRRHPETAEHRKQEIVVLLQRLEERDRRPSDREIAALVAVVRAPASWGLDWDTRAHAAMLSIPITSAQGKGVLSCEDLEALRDAHTGVPTARLAAIERALSEAYFRAVRLTEAREVLESALEAAKRAGALECQGRILINLAALARRFGDMGGARSWLQDARLLAEQCGGERLGGWVLRGRANLARHEGNLDEAIELHRAALSTYERLGPREMRVVTFHDMGLCLLEQGRLEEARTAARRAKALLSASPDIGLLGICHNLAGRIDLERCEYISARDHFREAHAIFIRGDNQRQGAVAELNRGMAELQLDNCAAARACMERALLSLEEEGEEAPPRQLPSLCSRRSA